MLKSQVKYLSYIRREVSLIRTLIQFLDTKVIWLRLLIIKVRKKWDIDLWLRSKYLFFIEMANYISISVQIITHYNKVTDIVDDKTFTITIKTIVSSNEEQDIKIRIINESLSMIRWNINEIESKNTK